MEKITKTEYWFLDLVVKGKWPLHILESAELELHVNRPAHGLSHLELVSVLHRLFQDGTLIADNENKVSFIPNKTEIEAGLQGTRKVYFGLTGQGGTLWESVTQPDWNQYIDASVGTAPDEVEIICSIRRLVEEYVSLQPFGQAVAGSEVWDVLSPWQATYWKTLSKGHRIKFLYKIDETEVGNLGSDGYLQQLKEIRRLNTWYVHPFD